MVNCSAMDDPDIQHPSFDLSSVTQLLWSHIVNNCIKLSQQADALWHMRHTTTTISKQINKKLEEFQHTS